MNAIMVNVELPLATSSRLCLMSVVLIELQHHLTDSSNLSDGLQYKSVLNFYAIVSP
jgi:hypothetical protein